jgi:glycosyl transferase family 2
VAGTSIEAAAPQPAQIHVEAIDAFRSRHAPLRFAPVVVVVAARDDAASIGAVLAAMPQRACGLPVDTLVVDDGSRDKTAGIARRAGVRVVRMEHPCGHGVALRVGYQLAREHGASYIVTLDADGHGDPAQLEDVLQPVVAGEADLVIGSRVLGGADSGGGKLRRVGIRVFSALVRALTGTKVTDTSSGYRAMRAEVTSTVRQRQEGRQVSELLIGAIYQGYRIAERPIVVHRRRPPPAGSGRQLRYGLRYGRVVVQTWWRERRAVEGGGVAATIAAVRARVAPVVPVLRVAGFVVAVGIVIAMAVGAARDVDTSKLTWWPLAPAAVAGLVWWLLLARAWALLVQGRATGRDVATWCRTQALRYLPGGIWAPASRVVVVQGTPLDRITTVAAENIIALCAALTVGGVALAVGDARWLALVLAVAAPVLGSALTARRTRISPARTMHVTVNDLVAFVAYAACASLVQAAVSGWHDALTIAGAAAVAWGAGLVVVLAPGGVGVREVTYVALAAGTLPKSELTAAAVTMRLLTIVVEAGVLLVAGRPGATGDAPRSEDETPAVTLEPEAPSVDGAAAGAGSRGRLAPASRSRRPSTSARWRERVRRASTSETTPVSRPRPPTRSATMLRSLPSPESVEAAAAGVALAAVGWAGAACSPAAAVTSTCGAGSSASGAPIQRTTSPVL